jgi:hypothetical protein
MSNRSRATYKYALTGLAALAVSAATSGCGSSHSTASGRPASAFTSGTPVSESPLTAPPVSVAQLRQGSPEHRITETIVAFYRAAWQNDATAACKLFSAAGRAGFLHAAAVSFPQSMNKYSSCEHAMQVYNATLADSAQTTVSNDPSFNTSALNAVRVQDIQVHGDHATAISPTNVAELINPKQLDLVRAGDEWMLDGSKSLNPSNLKQILDKAQAKGQLTPKKSG